MEHHKADGWQVAGRGTADDDTARFLRELRQLRDGAGLGHAELAARAHYPYDTIKAAEAGPPLPDLPVLSAYVRGCGGTVEEWEERWRRLTSTPALPVPASRNAGNSAAATAGARIGAATEVVDAPDPSVIMAALDRVAEGMAVGGSDTDATPLTVPPRPAYPADDSPAVSPPPVLSPADVPLGGESLADVSLPDISLPDTLLPDVSLPDVSLGDFTWADAFAAGPADNPVGGSADFSPFTPATQVTPADDPLVIPADSPPVTSAAGSTADWLSRPADPYADNLPKGWDPIRVSAAWPAIGSDDPRGAMPTRPDIMPPAAASPASSAGAASPAVAASTSASPANAWSTEAPLASAWSADEPPAGAPSGGVARPGTDTPAESGTRSVIRQSAWARSVDASGEPTGVARPGSRARTLMVAVVLVCVLAVVLAIFA